MSIEFSARYYDGKTSHGRDVAVRFLQGSEPGGDRLEITGLSEPHSVPLDQIRVAPRLADTTRSLVLPNRAKLESEANDAVDEMLRLAGRARPGGVWVHRLESSWRKALAALVALVLVSFVGVRFGVPIAARLAAARVPDALAFDIGRGALGFMDRTMLRASTLSAGRKEELRALFRSMARHYPDLPLALHFRRGVGPNAFALPNGDVVVTDELVALADDDQQILAVLAHELGHVHHRHGLRMAIESASMGFLIATYLGDASELASLTTTMPTVYLESRYSRGHEREADDFAYRYMSRYGVELHHFADILRRLRDEVGDADGPQHYVSSHPPTEERVRRFVRSGK